jgi:hypothetical protein
MSASRSLSAISINRQLGLSQGQSQEGVNIRNPSTAIFGVSSIDRYNLPLGEPSEIVASQSNPLQANTLSSPYDFFISNNNNFLDGFFTRLALNEVQFRWTIPTLTSRNNKLYIVWSPAGRNAITNVVGNGGGGTIFTMANTTGYSTGQTIVVGNLPFIATSAGTLNLNGVYTISSTTGTTLVCNNPSGNPAFTSLAVSGLVGIQYLITIPEGWYDLTNVDVSTSGSQGNLAYQFQSAVKAATGSTTFTCLYYWNTLNGVSAAVPSLYNCFGALAGASADKFYFYRYTDASQPNRVSLFEMMAWNNTQTSAVVQQGSPNVSLLSTPFVDLVCYNLTYNQSLKDADTGTTRDILCRLFLTPDAFTGNMANLGSNPILLHRCFPFPKQIKWNADQPIGNLRFQVYDSQGYVLSTGDGVSGLNQSAYYDSDMGDWSMTMLISEV